MSTVASGGASGAPLFSSMSFGLKLTGSFAYTKSAPPALHGVVYKLPSEDSTQLLESITDAYTQGQTPYRFHWDLYAKNPNMDVSYSNSIAKGITTYQPRATHTNAIIDPANVPHLKSIIDGKSKGNWTDADVITKGTIEQSVFDLVLGEYLIKTTSAQTGIQLNPAFTLMETGKYYIVSFDVLEYVTGDLNISDQVVCSITGLGRQSYLIKLTTNTKLYLKRSVGATDIKIGNIGFDAVDPYCTLTNLDDVRIVTSTLDPKRNASYDFEDSASKRLRVDLAPQDMTNRNQSIEFSLKLPKKTTRSIKVQLGTFTELSFSLQGSAANIVSNNLSKTLTTRPLGYASTYDPLTVTTSTVGSDTWANVIIQYDALDIELTGADASTTNKDNINNWPVIPYIEFSENTPDATDGGRLAVGSIRWGTGLSPLQAIDERVGGSIEAANGYSYSTQLPVTPSGISLIPYKSKSMMSESGLSLRNINEFDHGSAKVINITSSFLLIADTKTTDNITQYELASSPLNSHLWSSIRNSLTSATLASDAKLVMARKTDTGHLDFSNTELRLSESTQNKLAAYTLADEEYLLGYFNSDTDLRVNGPVNFTDNGESIINLALRTHAGMSEVTLYSEYAGVDGFSSKVNVTYANGLLRASLLTEIWDRTCTLYASIPILQDELYFINLSFDLPKNGETSIGFMTGIMHLSVTDDRSTTRTVEAKEVKVGAIAPMRFGSPLVTIGRSFDRLSNLEQYGRIKRTVMTRGATSTGVNVVVPDVDFICSAGNMEITFDLIIRKVNTDSTPIIQRLVRVENKTTPTTHLSVVFNYTTGVTEVDRLKIESDGQTPGAVDKVLLKDGHYKVKVVTSIAGGTVKTYIDDVLENTLTHARPSDLIGTFILELMSGDVEQYMFNIGVKDLDVPANNIYIPLTSYSTGELSGVDQGYVGIKGDGTRIAAATYFMAAGDGWDELWYTPDNDCWLSPPFATLAKSVDLGVNSVAGGGTIKYQNVADVGVISHSLILYAYAQYAYEGFAATPDTFGWSSASGMPSTDSTRTSVSKRGKGALGARFAYDNSESRIRVFGRSTIEEVYFENCAVHVAHTANKVSITNPVISMAFSGDGSDGIDTNMRLIDDPGAFFHIGFTVYDDGLDWELGTSTDTTIVAQNISDSNLVKEFQIFQQTSNMTIILRGGKTAFSSVIKPGYNEMIWDGSFFRRYINGVKIGSDVILTVGTQPLETTTLTVGCRHHLSSSAYAFFGNIKISDVWVRPNAAADFKYVIDMEGSPTNTTKTYIRKVLDNPIKEVVDMREDRNGIAPGLGYDSHSVQDKAIALIKGKKTQWFNFVPDNSTTSYTLPKPIALGTTFKLTTWVYPASATSGSNCTLIGGNNFRYQYIPVNTFINFTYNDTTGTRQDILTTIGITLSTWNKISVERVGDNLLFEIEANGVITRETKPILVELNPSMNATHLAHNPSGLGGTDRMRYGALGRTTIESDGLMELATNMQPYKGITSLSNAIVTDKTKLIGENLSKGIFGANGSGTVSGNVLTHTAPAWAYIYEDITTVIGKQYVATITASTDSSTGTLTFKQWPLTGNAVPQILSVEKSGVLVITWIALATTSRLFVQNQSSVSTNDIVQVDNLEVYEVDQMLLMGNSGVETIPSAPTNNWIEMTKEGDEWLSANLFPTDLKDVDSWDYADTVGNGGTAANGKSVHIETSIQLEESIVMKHGSDSTGEFYMSKTAPVALPFVGMDIKLTMPAKVDEAGFGGPAWVGNSTIDHPNTVLGLTEVEVYTTNLNVNLQYYLATNTTNPNAKVKVSGNGNVQLVTAAVSSPAQVLFTKSFDVDPNSMYKVSVSGVELDANTYMTVGLGSSFDSVVTVTPERYEIPTGGLTDIHKMQRPALVSTGNKRTLNVCIAGDELNEALLTNITLTKVSDISAPQTPVRIGAWDALVDGVYTATNTGAPYSVLLRGFNHQIGQYMAYSFDYDITAGSIHIRDDSDEVVWRSEGRPSKGSVHLVMASHFEWNREMRGLVDTVNFHSPINLENGAANSTFSVSNVVIGLLGDCYDIYEGKRLTDRNNVLAQSASKDSAGGLDLAYVNLDPTIATFEDDMEPISTSTGRLKTNSMMSLGGITVPSQYSAGTNVKPIVVKTAVNQGVSSNIVTSSSDNYGMGGQVGIQVSDAQMTFFPVSGNFAPTDDGLGSVVFSVTSNAMVKIVAVGDKGSMDDSSYGIHRENTMTYTLTVPYSTKLTGFIVYTDIVGGTLGAYDIRYIEGNQLVDTPSVEIPVLAQFEKDFDLGSKGLTLKNSDSKKMIAPIIDANTFNVKGKFSLLDTSIGMGAEDNYIAAFKGDPYFRDYATGNIEDLEAAAYTHGCVVRFNVVTKGDLTTPNVQTVVGGDTLGVCLKENKMATPEKYTEVYLEYLDVNQVHRNISTGLYVRHKKVSNVSVVAAHGLFIVKVDGKTKRFGNHSFTPMGAWPTVILRYVGKSGTILSKSRNVGLNSYISGLEVIPLDPALLPALADTKTADWYATPYKLGLGWTVEASGAYVKYVCTKTATEDLVYTTIIKKAKDMPEQCWLVVRGSSIVTGEISVFENSSVKILSGDARSWVLYNKKIHGDLTLQYSGINGSGAVTMETVCATGFIPEDYDAVNAKYSSVIKERASYFHPSLTTTVEHIAIVALKDNVRLSAISDDPTDRVIIGGLKFDCKGKMISTLNLIPTEVPNITMDTESLYAFEINYVPTLVEKYKVNISQTNRVTATTVTGELTETLLFKNLPTNLIDSIDVCPTLHTNLVDFRTEGEDVPVYKAQRGTFELDKEINLPAGSTWDIECYVEMPKEATNEPVQLFQSENGLEGMYLYRNLNGDVWINSRFESETLNSQTPITALHTRLIEDRLQHIRISKFEAIQDKYVVYVNGVQATTVDLNSNTLAFSIKHIGLGNTDGSPNVNPRHYLGFKARVNDVIVADFSLSVGDDEGLTRSTSGAITQCSWDDKNKWMVATENLVTPALFIKPKDIGTQWVLDSSNQWGHIGDDTLNLMNFLNLLPATYYANKIEVSAISGNLALTAQSGAYNPDNTIVTTVGLHERLFNVANTDKPQLKRRNGILTATLTSYDLYVVI